MYDFQIETIHKLITELNLALEGILLNQLTVYNDTLSESLQEKQRKARNDWIASCNKTMEHLIAIFRNGRIK